MTALKVGMLPCPLLEFCVGSSATDCTSPVSEISEPSDAYIVIVARCPCCTEPISIEETSALTAISFKSATTTSVSEPVASCPSTAFRLTTTPSIGEVTVEF